VVVVLLTSSLTTLVVVIVVVVECRRRIRPGADEVTSTDSASPHDDVERLLRSDSNVLGRLRRPTEFAEDDDDDDDEVGEDELRSGRGCQSQLDVGVSRPPCLVETDEFDSESTLLFSFFLILRNFIS